LLDKTILAISISILAFLIAKTIAKLISKTLDKIVDKIIFYLTIAILFSFSISTKHLISFKILLISIRIFSLKITTANISNNLL